MTAPATVLVVGEALVDVVRRLDGTVEEHPGGSPANVAVTLGRLGRPVHLLTCLGDDDRGRRVHDWLGASHVDVVGGLGAGTRTSSATATLDATGAASYVFAIDWHVDTAGVPTADLVHTGSIAAVLQPGADQVAAWLHEAKVGATVTYDPNVRPSLMTDHADALARIERLVALADVVKVSDEDLAWLHPELDPAAAAALWLTRGPALVVVTAGGEGALALTAAHGVQITAPRVVVADTVGAGDTFMGALIDGLVTLGAVGPEGRQVVADLDEPGLTALVERCAAAAAITVTRSGANPPTAAELDAWVAERG
ncbi:carbohydrate kinase family protein [Cellulomonas soli]|uniref:Fructokinase n=1 Tax=Cellulomonas soli TaxID=931535 RepID=A0A512PGK0_9CELL|nr:carbohydrate kinase [Cellulomonas soli]NYI58195.1 fructokinase [Cellulomonas soli]GEP70328.1 fructokinase [Cellulomonas soli]